MRTLSENLLIRTRGSLMTLAACLLTLVASAAPARAQTSTFIALLNGGQETPPDPSKAFGVAFVTFSMDTGELCYSISFSDSTLTSNEIAAHFHASAPPGQAAGVRIPLPLGNPKNGCVTPDPPLTDAEVSDLFAGLWYVNVHTMNFGGGEIRGQVIAQSNPIF